MHIHPSHELAEVVFGSALWSPSHANAACRFCGISACLLCMADPSASGTWQDKRLAAPCEQAPPQPRQRLELCFVLEEIARPSGVQPFSPGTYVVSARAVQQLASYTDKLTAAIREVVMEALSSAVQPDHT